MFTNHPNHPSFPDHVKVILVLVVIPLIFNCGAIWIQDNLLMKTEFTEEEKHNLYNVFYQTEDMMGEGGLPSSFSTEDSLMIKLGTKKDVLDIEHDTDDDSAF